MKISTAFSILSGLMLAAVANAGVPRRIQFLVVDPRTGRPVSGRVTVDDGVHAPTVLVTGPFVSGETQVLDLANWSPVPLLADIGRPMLVKIAAGESLSLRQDAGQRPVKVITIKVTATRLTLNRAPVGGASTERSKDEISKFINTAGADTKSLTRGQKGVTEDSAGQQHVRGEHSEISYVIDGVPLPDRLSGGQGSIVVPSTIDRLEILTGGFAPEFGGDTAAILNIATLPSARASRTDTTLEGGDYHSVNGDVTAVGPLGRKSSFVVDVSSTRTDVGVEPLQPDIQDAHNAGASRNYFAKFRTNPNGRDSISLTLSHNPNALQIGNRTGLPDSFAQSGEGYGFLGLRNADGTRPDVNGGNNGLYGAGPYLLPSQQAAGMDINQQEVDEFASLSWQRRVSNAASGQIALTLLHSGQDLTNNNPTVDVLNLYTEHPDNSIEFNPTASRNIHHVQLNGSYVSKTGGHQFKAGFLLDAQSGNESYQVIPASQLALDELAALDPALAPAGTVTNETDIDGFPVFRPTSGQSPVLDVQRKGLYKAAYVQDTWRASRKLTANYGLRADWYNMNQNLGQPDVSKSLLSPRVNLAYAYSARANLRASYNKLFNIPPLAQGAIVGQPIQPETLSQYDLGVDYRVTSNQTASLAYYYKDIRNQVDVGLLIPGSEIGLYSGVNFDRGAVHGVEASYDVSSHRGVDGYLNLSYSSARPNGFDNTGAPVPDYNDHDQRFTVGTGLAYTWRGGATAAVTYQFGSGLASSPIAPSVQRISRSETDLRLTTGDRLFRGRGGLGLDVQNLFDERKVINFQSGFSGTRFQIGRRILLSASFHF